MTTKQRSKPLKFPADIIKDKNIQKLSPIKKELLECYKSRQPVLLHGNDSDDCRRELIKEVWLAGGGVDQEEQYFLEDVSIPPKSPTSKEELENKFKKDWIDKYKTIDSRSSEGNSYKKELSLYIQHRSHITDKTWRRIDCGSWNGKEVRKELLRSIGDIHDYSFYNKNRGFASINNMNDTARGYLFLCRGLIFLDNLQCRGTDEDQDNYSKLAKVINDRTEGFYKYNAVGIPLAWRARSTEFDWLVAYTYGSKLFPPYFKDQFKLISLDGEVKEKKMEGFRAAIQTEDCEFFLSGNMWTISYEGKTIHLQDSIGLQYIHYLLEESGNEFHSLGLMREINKSPVPKDENIFGNTDEEQQKGQFMEEGLSVGNAEGSTEEILDEEAIKEYKKRYSELKSELQDDTLSSIEIAEIEKEIAEIVKVLGAGLDIHGQSRKVSNPAERSRRSVSKAINESLDKIKDKENGIPALWKHFDNTLAIGISCSYKPEKSIPWAL